ncbi:MAG: DinB family protein [Gemmataceae bacterium]
MTTRDLLDQIRFTHGYTLRLLEATPRDDWGRVPPAGVSHVAWQVGHLAMAGYRLALERVRGHLPGDDLLIGEEFLNRFGRDSVPDPAPVPEPADELLLTYQSVHLRIQQEIAALAPEELNQPLLRPHAICKTKGDCLAWCAQHEMLHAGQVGLLRRQLGHRPLW